MPPDQRYKVAHQAKTGTVVGDTYIGDKPDGFEGAWPRNGRVVIVAWQKKLTVESKDNLAKLGDD